MVSSPTLDDLVQGRVPADECPDATVRFLQHPRTPEEFRSIINKRGLLCDEVVRTLYCHPDLDLVSRNLLVRLSLVYAKQGYQVTVSGEFLSQEELDLHIALHALWLVSEQDMAYAELATTILSLGPVAREILLGLLQAEEMSPKEQVVHRTSELIQVAEKLQ